MKVLQGWARWAKELGQGEVNLFLLLLSPSARNILAIWVHF